MKKIEIQGVSKTIGKKLIINNISETIYSGEVYGLLGPNGAGKTTIIKMIMGLMKVSAGKIIIEGKDVNEDFCQGIAGVRALIEQPAIYPHLSGYNNLKVFAKMDNVGEDRINEIIELVGLKQDIYRKAKEYSLGMKQRLGIGIALLSNTKILILDEPTNGLDPEGILELRKYLQKIAKEKGVSVIVSSHILSEMSQLCDRFAIMKNGQLVKVVTKNEVTVEEDVFKYFIEVDNSLSAYQLLKDAYKTQLKDIGVSIETKREKIPHINKMLIESDIKVYGITTEENPLEKFYFDIINGKDTDIKNV